MALLNIVSTNVPGIELRENQAGAIPAQLAAHNTAYMLGTSSKAGAPNTPSVISDLTDFENVFGNDSESPSYHAARLFFAQRPTVGLTFCNVPATDTYPDLADVTEYLTQFSKEDRQGFLFAPELFQHPSFASDHTALASVLEAHCSNPRYYWVAIVDPTPDTQAQPSISAAVTALSDERSPLASPLGHSWYYGTYVRDIEDNLIPPSPVAVGVALRRISDEGYHQPPAGVKYPVFGVKAVELKFTDAHQEVLNDIGVNLFRVIPQHGLVVWGARTLSALQTYRYANNRVIMNVLAGTARSAYDPLIFQATDGLGIVFGVAKATTVNFLEPARLAGYLFGATPDDAYRVICDATNNPGALLDAGQLNIDIYVRVVGTLEFIGLRLNKVGLATPLSSLFATDDIATLTTPA